VEVCHLAPCTHLRFGATTGRRGLPKIGF
jgi:hypothetical protein